MSEIGNNIINPFRIPLKSGPVADALERLLGLKSLISCYDRRPRHNGKGVHGQAFLDHTLQYFDVETKIENPELLESIPTEGPVLFVANHPFGGIEGVAMTRELSKYRPDLLVMTNKMLTTIPELQQYFIGVDVLSKNAAQENAAGVRVLSKHLRKGGAVLIYPAGMVSAIELKTRSIRDRQWDNIVGRFVQKYQATVVPFYVSGRNTLPFYLLGLIHKRLRTLYLPREFANKRGFKLRLKMGAPITPSEISGLSNAQQITDYLRLSTDLLSRQKYNPLNLDDQSKVVALNVKRTNQDALERDIASLNEFCLLSKNGFSVYCAPHKCLGSMMGEIARARESTFRAAGEGTGKAEDSDHFDDYYLHLLLWDETKKCLVGGYRIGQTDKIVKERGVKALYSRKHYYFDEKYIKKLGPSLEMGRSFIVPEYQRHPRALDMLWQGIGHYVAANPQYRTLFGCVSISQEHSEMARAFISDSMMQSFRAEQEYLQNVRPVVSLKVRGKLWTNEVLASLSDIAIINKLVGRCDPGKSVPTLLRHYLALNGRIVCFSVNRGFNNSLDGLILVDLTKTPEKYLKRYLGKSGSENFLNKWKQNEVAA